ncbi:hypothetical protein NC653_032202 [Populus alba x Populus x berolinensis]|uniref:Uncharacterized protein n=1 Tax=Populus alba x Populus x berolinensis TaxID=444605 RepID=A0AAD6LQS6_9ROSI|nr:hypothetical protein NC653_032202 [Populus alba x Populus x berolinensis]
MQAVKISYSRWCNLTRKQLLAVETYGREHLEAVGRQDFNRDDSPKVSPVVAIGSPKKACGVVGELSKGMRQQVVYETRVGARLRGHVY